MKEYTICLEKKSREFPYRFFRYFCDRKKNRILLSSYHDSKEKKTSLVICQTEIDTSNLLYSIIFKSTC